MAANYWDSTQARFWTFTRDELQDMRDRQLQDEENSRIIARYPLPEPRLLNIYIQQQIVKLGRRMNLRQQPLATAQIYVKRFYTRVEIRRTNLYLVMTTAVYLACKVEECPVHIRLVLAEAARQWPELGVNDINKIGECEFHLISTLSSQMILHHPYRTLSDLAPTFSMTTDENSLAHSIINDHYNTDLPLLYPPHIIAMTAIFLAVVLRPTQTNLQAHAAATTSTALQGAFEQGLAAIGGAGSRTQPGKITFLIQYFAESQIDMEAVMMTTQEIASLYNVWDNYGERSCKEAISRVSK